MMQLNVKFFASLSEQTGLTEITIEAENGATVLDAWKRATAHRELPTNILCAVNMTYAQLDDRVNDGDEIAFFPPVTGGRQ